MPTKPTPASPAAASPKRRRVIPIKNYDLFATDGTSRLRLQLTDEGVSPGLDRLEFMLNRRWTSRSYGDVDTVVVSSSRPPDSAPIALCRIAFLDGSDVTISSANANSLSDGTRNAEFSDFVKDLHRRLVASGAAEGFRSGYRAARSWGLLLSLVGAVGLFVALPVALFLATRRTELLLMTLFGLLLIVPGARLLGSSRRGSYPPDAPPNFFR